MGWMGGKKEKKRGRRAVIEAWGVSVWHRLVGACLGRLALTTTAAATQEQVRAGVRGVAEVRRWQQVWIAEGTGRG